MAKFSKKQRLYIYQFCADMIKAGLPLFDSLQKLQVEGRSLLGRSFSNKLNGVLMKMKQETSVASVFSGLVPDSELSVITAAEKSGSLADGYLTLVSVIHYNDELRKKIIGALVFPLIMISLSLVVIAGYSQKVFPAFASVVPVEKWPGVTQNLYNFGTALYGGLWLKILIGFIVAVILIRFMMANFSGVLRNKMVDKILPFSTYRQLTSSIFLNNLSLMLSNNIPLTDALSIIRLNAGRWLRWHLDVMIDNMAKGTHYSKALDSGLMGTEELLNISLYAELPSFNDVLRSVSERSRERIQEYIKKLSGLLKNLATVILGGCVIWVFTALFALMDTLSKMTNG
ncbi:type II secretion protein F [Salmonella enterica]|uniref:Type II secretion system F family protein n=1 Tax=Salmonella enterica subsp. salamae TaxID=59202 RepID=A0A8E6MSJ0_SALER|nr:type II secretion system F family protein [Salmonella enterica]ECF6030394.1 type II secretion protein F [Salmonella enterica subsp. salamae serovar Greenside]QVP50850.1 type II secretion system F family protein [Salmonella enterica subsp. salamae]HCM1922489.1 type II secretion system F family protein [Salmonella enterica subsp. salamae serovar 16:m,t:e,n,x]EAZ4875671.1 type II secretion protein F [Salmonella enterica]EBP0116471.1 type II secretion protein F [Salmonella enterica]